MSDKKVISMVPSWTETLITCGIPVVGRTRFCIHPKDKIQNIPVVGGTKDIDWDKVYETKADLLLLDQEENPKEMADNSTLPVFSTHVTCIADVARECERLGHEFNNQELLKISERWKKIDELPRFPIKQFYQFPGVLEWIKKPKYDGQIKEVYYMIWKNPWMCVSRDTFIGSVIDKLGLGFMVREFDIKYPEIDLNDLSKKETVLFFSTEPFPFHTKKDELKKLGFPCAIVNGENFSWFGVRSLNFLEDFFKNQISSG